MPSQVASARTIALRGTPAGSGSITASATSINVAGHVSAPAGGRRPLARPSGFGFARCWAFARFLRLPHGAGKFRRYVPVATSLTIALRCTSARAGMRVVSWRSIFVDARSQAASGRPRENAFFRVCPRARSFRASPSANVCYSLNRVREPSATLVQKGFSGRQV